MPTPLAQTPSHAPAPDESKHWHDGRLVIHSDGPDAGAMRLDLDLPGFTSVDEVIHHVHLLIPGEASPLSPFDAVGENGRFIMSFFSADISNDGELPEQAIVSWTGMGSQLRVKAVPTERACRADQQETWEDIVTSSPDLKAHPETVIAATLGGILLMSLGSLAFLVLN